MDVQDCIIVGGGPAGLNAAVVLGRCRRKVLLFDTAQYRNRSSHGIHNYLTRDGILPNEFIGIAHKEIHKYGVQLIHKKVLSAHKKEDGTFAVNTDDGSSYQTKKILIATGLIDYLPPIEGFKEMYGQSVFHCPYCDGWEVQNKILGVYARNKEGWELALTLKNWSNKITLYTDGKNTVRPFQKSILNNHNIAIIKTPIQKLVGKNKQLQKIVLTNGEEIACEAMFFVNGFTQQCNLLETFGCKVNTKGVVITNRLQQTNIAGVYVAGDAAKDMQFVIIAAAEGAKAAVSIHKELQKEEYNI